MTEGKCPSCGAPVRFTAGTAQVLVCEHCQTVVGRKDASLEDRGKVARIVDTDSPFQLGISGRLGKQFFRIVGHLQKDHGAGPWDEWCLELENDRVAWLSEAEGRLSLQYFVDAAPNVRLEGLAPNGVLTLQDQRFVIEELGSARTVAAEGELPSDLDPSVDARYVDLSGPKGAIATLDFADRPEAPELFVGQMVGFDELNIDPHALRPRTRKVALQDARCPQCNGALDLKAPDQTKRVACPFCGALSEVSQGKLAFLAHLEKPGTPPPIPLGRKGKLAGVEWVCIAFLVRSCRVEGTRYPWSEYLLFHPAHGFRWLMESNGHWVYLVPIAAGEVVLRGRAALHGGRTYKRFQEVVAQTEYVLGECYWQVSVGETALATEYVDPPRSLNLDQTDAEVTYTLGSYLSPKEVQEAFHLERLPRPSGIAPSQPNPVAGRVGPAFAWAGIYAAAVLALFVVLYQLSARQTVMDEKLTVPPGVASGSPEAMHFSAPFELKRRGNLQVGASAEMNNEWLGLSGDLVNEATQEVTSFYLELSRYSGYEDGESWSEGSPDQTEYLSALPPGRYVLRVTPQFEGSLGARVYRLRLVSDVPRFLWVLLAWLALGIWPLVLAFRSGKFESERWSESSGGGDE